MDMKKGQIQIGLLVSGFALLASIAAPILWVSDIKETNAVQENRLANSEKKFEEIKTEIKEIRSENKLLNDKIDALLWRQGIDPKTIK